MKRSTRNKNINGVIYRFTNKINGKQYIGTTFNKLKIRVRTHFNLKYSGAPLLVKAIKKYGEKEFFVDVIDNAKTIGELNDKEIYWIKKLKTKAPNGYNILSGGFTNEMAVEANKEPVKCITNNKSYDSITSASKHTGIPTYSIGFNCIGRQDTAGGMEFEYVDKEKRSKSLKRKQKRKKHIIDSRVKIVNTRTREIYLGVYDASRKTGISKSTIQHCVEGTMDEYKGMSFEFVNKKRKNLANKVRKI